MINTEIASVFISLATVLIGFFALRRNIAKDSAEQQGNLDKRFDAIERNLASFERSIAVSNQDYHSRLQQVEKRTESIEDIKLHQSKNEVILTNVVEQLKTLVLVVSDFREEFLRQPSNTANSKKPMPSKARKST